MVGDESVHSPGADIEEVFGRSVAISQTLASARPPLDQRRARPVMAEEVDRLQRAGEPAADDRDMRRGSGQMT